MSNEVSGGEYEEGATDHTPSTSDGGIAEQRNEEHTGSGPRDEDADSSDEVPTTPPGADKEPAAERDDGKDSDDDTAAEAAREQAAAAEQARAAADKAQTAQDEADADAERAQDERDQAAAAEQEQHDREVAEARKEVERALAAADQDKQAPPAEGRTDGTATDDDHQDQADQPRPAERPGSEDEDEAEPDHGAAEPTGQEAEEPGEAAAADDPGEAAGQEPAAEAEELATDGAGDEEPEAGEAAEPADHDDAADPVEDKAGEQAGDEDEEAGGGEAGGAAGGGSELDDWETEQAAHEEQARAAGRGDPPPADLDEVEALTEALDPDSDLIGSQRQPVDGDDGWERGRDAAGGPDYEEGDADEGGGKEGAAGASDTGSAAEDGQPAAGDRSGEERRQEILDKSGEGLQGKNRARAAAGRIEDVPLPDDDAQTEAETEGEIPEKPEVDENGGEAAEDPDKPMGLSEAKERVAGGSREVREFARWVSANQEALTQAADKALQDAGAKPGTRDDTVRQAVEAARELLGYSKVTTLDVMTHVPTLRAAADAANRITPRPGEQRPILSPGLAEAVKVCGGKSTKLGYFPGAGSFTDSEAAEMTGKTHESKINKRLSGSGYDLKNPDRNRRDRR